MAISAPDDEALLARQAAGLALNRPVDAPRRIAQGRSCAAFTVASAGERPAEWVVRVPITGTDRSIRFHAEATIGAALAARGQPVATWQVVDVEGTACAIGPRLPGVAITFGATWTTDLRSQLAELLADLHQLPAVGHGPLIDRPGTLRGELTSVLDGVRQRWRRASCWPFDGSDLAVHPVAHLMPELVPQVAPRRLDLLAAAEGPVGVVHSDLHREHLLVDEKGSLTGVLDFGDAFVGSVAWDIASLRWYYGADVGEATARRHPGADMDDRARLLTIALGLYKLAKTPDDPAVARRLRATVRNLTGA